MSEKVKNESEEIKEALNDTNPCKISEKIDLEQDDFEEDDLEEIDLGKGELLRIPKTLPPTGAFVAIITGLGPLFDIVGRVCTAGYNPPTSMRVRTWDAVANKFLTVTVFRTQIMRWRRFKKC